MMKSGFICYSTFPYFDISTRKNQFKKRPVLVLAKADSGDYNVLPISTITATQHIDADYDIKVDPLNYPKLKLSKVSYVRVHKQSTAYESSLSFVSDMKKEYPDLFLKILEILEEYNKKIMNECLT